MNEASSYWLGYAAAIVAIHKDLSRAGTTAATPEIVEQRLKFADGMLEATKLHALTTAGT